MEKFRLLKSRLISSKRDSQKLEEKFLTKIIQKDQEISQNYRKQKIILDRHLHTVDEEVYKANSNDYINEFNNCQRFLMNNSLKQLQTAKVRAADEIFFMSSLRNRLNINKNEIDNEEQMENDQYVEDNYLLDEFKVNLQEQKGDIYQQIRKLVENVNSLKEKERQKEGSNNKNQILSQLSKIKTAIGNAKSFTNKKLLDFYEDQQNNQFTQTSQYINNNLNYQQSETQRQFMELSERFQTKYCPFSSSQLQSNRIQQSTHQQSTSFFNQLQNQPTEVHQNLLIRQQDQQKISKLFSDTQPSSNFSLPSEGMQQISFEQTYEKINQLSFQDTPVDIIMESQSSKYKKIFGILKSNSKKENQSGDRKINHISKIQHQRYNNKQKSLLKYNKANKKDKHDKHAQSLASFKNEAQNYNQILESISKAMNQNKIRPRLRK